MAVCDRYRIHTFPYILSTTRPEYHQVERIANGGGVLCGLDEAWEDFRQKFDKAVGSDRQCWHIIKCQTALGKTQAMLELLRDTHQKVLIAVPTNKLKREVCVRAEKMGIPIAVSPSLHELEDELPDIVRDEIQDLYDAGKSPMSRVNKAIAEDDPECARVFKKYKRELAEFDKSDGHAITTHRRLTNMDVSKYDLVMIDEDIIYSTVIPSRETVSVRDLKKLKKKLAARDPLAAKIKKTKARHDEAQALYNARREAKQEATMERNIEIARTMIADGEPVDKIMRYTGLAQNEIEKLQVHFILT